jgi:hypothetical protein
MSTATPIAYTASLEGTDPAAWKLTPKGGRASKELPLICFTQGSDAKGKIVTRAYGWTEWSIAAKPSIDDCIRIVAETLKVDVSRITL